MSEKKRGVGVKNLCCFHRAVQLHLANLILNADKEKTGTFSFASLLHVSITPSQLHLGLNPTF